MVKSVSKLVNSWAVGLGAVHEYRTVGDGGCKIEEDGRRRFPVLTLVWALTTTAASVYVIIDHPSHRMQFFTNWSMCIHAAVSILMILMHLKRKPEGESENKVGSLLLPFDWAVSWVVVIGSRFIIADSNEWAAAILLDRPWIATWGDYVYHVLPPLMSIGLRWDHPEVAKEASEQSASWKVIISALPVCFMLLYRAIFDTKEVYMFTSRADAFGLDALSAGAVAFATLCYWLIPVHLPQNE
jgi:hypothetical protein